MNRERQEKEKEETTSKQEKRMKVLESRINAQLQSLASSSGNELNRIRIINRTRNSNLNGAISFIRT